MNNFLVLGISLVIITMPIGFTAFLLGYSWGKREAERRFILTAHNVMDFPDLPDDLPEYRTVVTQRDRRHVL
jgi:hypothetical protein